MRVTFSDINYHIIKYLTKLCVTFFVNSLNDSQEFFWEIGATISRNTAQGDLSTALEMTRGGDSSRLFMGEFLNLGK